MKVICVGFLLFLGFFWEGGFVFCFSSDTDCYGHHSDSENTAGIQKHHPDVLENASLIQPAIFRPFPAILN